MEDATAWLREQTDLHQTVIRRACQDRALPLAQAADLTDKMGSILFGRGYATTVGDLAARVAEAASARGERQAEALARSVRGSMLWHAGCYAAAGGELRRCLPLCEGVALRRLRANVLQLLGANARVLGDFDVALADLGHRSRAGACLVRAREHFRRLDLDADAAETERLLVVLIECPSP
ncbi:hypothetical protein ACFYUY_07890 [Kitasatospora sp. NPDC004745]|uniref:hypothetical protein n=1 Tax=Kitasatospora sp. NPDC004745 TaxID=3364019 RepID=UPI0036C09D70